WFIAERRRNGQGRLFPCPPQTSLDSIADTKQNAKRLSPTGPAYQTTFRLEDRHVRKRLLISVLKYGLGIALLAFVIWRNWEPSGDPPRGGLRSLWQAHVIEGQPVNGGPLALAAAIFSAAVLLTFLRWYGLIRAQGFPCSPANAVRL